MILLDTNAVVWLHHGHRRGRRLERHVGQLYASPASLLEIQFLVEVGRIHLRSGTAVRDLADDDRWVMDNPPPSTGSTVRSTWAGRGIHSTGCSSRTPPSAAGASRRATALCSSVSDPPAASSCRPSIVGGRDRFADGQVLPGDPRQSASPQLHPTTGSASGCTSGRSSAASTRSTTRWSYRPG